MTDVQNLIFDSMIRAYEKLSQLSGAFSFVEDERMQRFESAIPFGLFNSVFTFKPSEGIDPVVEIRSLASAYHERGQKLSWLTSSHKPDEAVDQALAINQFNQVDVISGQALSLKDWSYERAAIPGLEVRAVRDAEEIDQYRKVILEGFSIPESMAEIFSKVFVDGPNKDTTMVQHYLAYLNGAPVTTLTTFIEGDVAGFYNISTRESYRSKGLASSTLAFVLSKVQQSGAKWAVIHATPMARSVYPKVGFQEELTIRIFNG
ncbi:GNAT superfamily N-acetyltransferase [Paenibacillus rhizosphaerae]|uniref:GNAT superfamily N-acetyltransferase n=1 Tax=Paenibacillus rhizosphaerae TaxID=297318 RepID=A0A839TNQ4_9BACL|nr:GNAT family N-acetyltransferase [Paenibacillus rhizosphaerae]MBB3128312.1 GNAT superfamily N-acetyltransferase [Paenibacillus rhizosphaerae]